MMNLDAIQYRLAVARSLSRDSNADMLMLIQEIERLRKYEKLWEAIKRDGSRLSIVKRLSSTLEDPHAHV